MTFQSQIQTMFNSHSVQQNSVCLWYNSLTEKILTPLRWMANLQLTSKGTGCSVIVLPQLFFGQISETKILNRRKCNPSNNNSGQFNKVETGINTPNTKSGSEEIWLYCYKKPWQKWIYLKFCVLTCNSGRLIQI